MASLLLLLLVAPAAGAASDVEALVAPCARSAGRTQGFLDVVARSGVEPVANGGSRAPLSVAPSRRGLPRPPPPPDHRRSSAASDTTALVAPRARFARLTQGLLDVVAGSGVEPVADGAPPPCP